MPLNAYWAGVRIGGGTGALDAKDGADLADKDMALLLESTDTARFWWLDDDASGAEGEGVTNPDANAGTKSWLLLGLTLPNTGLHILDTNASYDLIIKPGSSLSADRTLTLTTGDANRTLTLNENFTIGDGTNITITGVTAARTITLNENLTIGDGTDITLTGVTQANTLTLHESLTLGDGNSGTLTFSASGDTLTVGETLTLDGASGKTLTLEENLTISDGTDITLTGVTQANTLTLHESLTLGDGNDGTITFKQASKALNVEGTNLIPYTGWPNTPGVTLSFVGGTTRTLTVTETSAFYYIQGVKYVLGGNKTVVIDDTEGLWYIYFDGSTLTASQTIWSFSAEDKALVAVLYWAKDAGTPANGKAIFLGYELHNFFMDGSTHGRLHYVGGARWESGLLVSDALSEDVNVSAGDIWDEDTNIPITDGAGAALFEQVLSPAQLPIYYRSGASNWRIYETTGVGGKANATDLGYVTGGALYYNKLNGTWASATVSGVNHIAMYAIATNEQTEPVALIMGQREDQTLANARENNVFSGLSLAGLPFEEMVVLARLIIKESGSGVYYTLEDVTDLRAAFGDGNITSPLITDHGGLGGLGDNDHAGVYCLESVFGNAIGTGLVLDSTTLKASAILQKYHGIDPAANVQSLLGAADYAAMMVLLSGTATGAFSFNSQNLTSVGTIGATVLTLDRGATPTVGQLLLQANGLGGLSALVYSADNVMIGFDIYFDIGAWKSLDAGSNFDIYKTGDVLRIGYDSGVTIGAAPTMNNGLTLDTSGNIDIVVHDAATVGLKLGGVVVTASAAELNLCDGASYGANDSGGVGFRAIKVPNL